MERLRDLSHGTCTDLLNTWSAILFLLSVPWQEQLGVLLQVGECCGEEVFASGLVEVVKHLIEKDIFEDDDDNGEDIPGYCHATQGGQMYVGR